MVLDDYLYHLILHKYAWGRFTLKIWSYVHSYGADHYNMARKEKPLVNYFYYYFKNL